MRKTKLVNDEYYHIYNRGVDKREVFLDHKDYKRFLISMKEFNQPDPIGSLYQKSFKDKMFLGTRSPIGDLVPKNKLVDIVCYCLNPNHFHFILRQKKENGISKFLLKLSSGYTSYFNRRYIRSGSLFQGSFKSIHINSNEYLLFLSAYVNCNSEIHGIALAENYEWSSFSEYLGKKNDFCQKGVILGQFGNIEEYAEFAKVNAEEMRDKKELERLEN